MKSVKKYLRLLGLILLLLLASVGVGLNGGIPIPRVRKKEDVIELSAAAKPADDAEIDRLEAGLHP